MKTDTRKTLAGRVLATAAASLLALGAIDAGANDSCREWRNEHAHWKVRAIRCYLHGAPQQDVDEAVFEMLQREAYLTSCETSVQMARGDMIGWRLADRSPDEYGSAVLESVLERSGFDVGLRGLFEVAPSPSVASRPAAIGGKRRRGWSARAN